MKGRMRNFGMYLALKTRDHGYPQKIKPCDKYDVSNLRLLNKETAWNCWFAGFI